jgi:hypothetical protein
MRNLKIESLPSVKNESWIDKDFIILHACFQCLRDFVEKEDAFMFSPEEDENTQILHELYDWWMIRKDEGYELDEIPTNKDDEMLIKLMKIRSWLWI